MLTSKRVVRCLARWHSTTFACEDAMPMSAPSRPAPSSQPPSSSSTFPNSHSAPVLVSRAIHLPPVSHRPHILIPTTYLPTQQPGLLPPTRPSLRSVVLHTRPAVLPHHHYQACVPHPTTLPLPRPEPVNRLSIRTHRTFQPWSNDDCHTHNSPPISSPDLT
jgi:hypothetical protein